MNTYDPTSGPLCDRTDAMILRLLKDGSFQGAILKQILFRQTGIWSLRATIKSMCFDGALIDKPVLKGLEADLSRATMLS